MLIKFLYLVLGVLVVFLLAFAWSTDRKKIKYKYLVIILAVQMILAFFMLKSSAGIVIISHIQTGFNYLNSYAHDGAYFVFGGLTNDFVFFFNVGMTIVLVSALIGILQHIKILPLIIKFVGTILSFVTGMGKMESFNAVSSLTVGQQENFIIYKKILGHLPSNILYTMSATAMSTVTLAIAGAYMEKIDPKYVCVAMLLNMFGTFFVLHVINPYEKTEDLDYSELHKDYEESTRQGFFEMLAEYILDGFKVAVIVCVMIIGFTALLSMLDGICHGVFGITFRDMLGYVFYPLAWILNIHGQETLIAGQIMGTKMVTNELVAMGDLAKQSASMSAHTTAVISVFLVSFANFSSIGIIIGAIQALNKEASIKVSKFSLKILYGATLVSFLTAVIIGFIV